MTDEIDEIVASFQAPLAEYCRKYRHALEVVARHHKINSDLLWGSSDHQTQPPDEDAFYLQLARAFLVEAVGDSAWVAARAIAAISAIDSGASTEAIGAGSGASIRGKDAHLAMARAAHKSVEAASAIVKRSGFPRRGPGRPETLSADSERIATIFRDANVDCSLSWRDCWSQLQKHIETISASYDPAKRASYEKETFKLLGPTGARAREVYRTLHKRGARRQAVLGLCFPRLPDC